MSFDEKKRPQEPLTLNGVLFFHDDIFRVVDAFYSRVQKDPILQIPFKSVVDWPEHVDNLTHFWWSRFGGPPYRFNHYNPVGKHFFAGFNRELLSRWLLLFRETLDQHLTPEQASLWGLVSERMGESLFIKNEFFKRDYEAKNPRGNREDS